VQEKYKKKKQKKHAPQLTARFPTPHLSVHPTATPTLTPIPPPPHTPTPCMPAPPTPSSVL